MYCIYYIFPEGFYFNLPPTYKFKLVFVQYIRCHIAVAPAVSSPKSELMIMSRPQNKQALINTFHNTTSILAAFVLVYQL